MRIKFVKFVFKFLKHRPVVLGFLSSGAVAGLFLFAQNQPFRSIEDFVLFGEEGVNIAEEVQSTSGDIGSNKEIKIAEKVKVVGNLFGKEIHIAEQSEIDGNVFAKKLKLAKNATILGTSSTEISFPVAKIPDIPFFTPGTQDITIATSNFVLPAGSYRDIVIKEKASAVLSGTYNLHSLRLASSAAILFDATTTLNIQDSLHLGSHAIANPRPSALSVHSIKLNYAGTNPVTIGERAILGFRLVAPKATVQIGEEGLLRGAVWGRAIKVGEKSVLSRELTGARVARPEEIVNDPEGGVYPINIILVAFAPDADLSDALRVATVINGRIVGFIATLNLYQIEVQTKTIEELESLVDSLRERTDLKIVGVLRDFLLPIDI